MIKNNIVKKIFSIRINEVLLKKIRVIAKYENRSVSGKIFVIVRDYIL